MLILLAKFTLSVKSRGTYSTVISLSVFYWAIIYDVFGWILLV